MICPYCHRESGTIVVSPPGSTETWLQCKQCGRTAPERSWGHIDMV